MIAATSVPPHPPAPPAPATVEPPPPPPAPPSRFVHVRRPLLAAAAALVGVIATLVVSIEKVFVLVALFVVVVPFERLVPRHRQRVLRPQLGTDLAWAVLGTPLSAIGTAAALVVALVSFAWLPGLLLRPLVTALPAWPRAALGVVLFDLGIYWAHRFGHEIPVAWRFHRIHHSTVHLDWISGFRAHPLDGLIVAPAFVMLLVAGFSPEQGGALLALQIVIGIFLHANVRWRWRPLQRIVITPEFHHWHHANERDAHCSNYATLLPLWDMVFGTYYMPRDRRPTIYGVDDVVPFGVVGQLLDPLRGWPRPRTVLRHPIATARRMIRAIPEGRRQIVASVRRPRRPVSVHSPR